MTNCKWCGKDESYNHSNCELICTMNNLVVAIEKLTKNIDRCMQI